GEVVADHATTEHRFEKTVENSNSHKLRPNKPILRMEYLSCINSAYLQRQPRRTMRTHRRRRERGLPTPCSNRRIGLVSTYRAEVRRFRSRLRHCTLSCPTRRPFY